MAGSILVGPLAHPLALPHEIVTGLLAPSLSGASLASLFPEVTPAPAAPGAARPARAGPSGTGDATAALTAESGVITTRQGSLLLLAVSVALGIAVFGAWFTMAGQGRRVAASLARRRGRHPR